MGTRRGASVTDVRVHVPAPQRSVRPADLDAAHVRRLRGADPEPPATPRRREPGTVALVVGALLLAFLVKVFLAQAFYIPSGSMIPTLEIGDRVIVEKVTYRVREPERGEVVVFRRPGIERPGGPSQALREFLQGLGLLQPDEDMDLIKRLIGLPGETVELRDGTLLVDGRPLPEPYAVDDERDFGPVRVPEGHYLVLGDNRPNSDDSRFSLGFVPRDDLVGRAFVIVWPPGNARVGLDAEYLVSPP
jgi:signal peptidase I